MGLLEEATIGKALLLFMSTTGKLTGATVGTDTRRRTRRVWPVEDEFLGLTMDREVRMERCEGVLRARLAMIELEAVEEVMVSWLSLWLSK